MSVLDVPLESFCESECVRFCFLLLFPVSSFMNREDGSVTLVPSENPDAQTFVNGSVVTEPTVLHHVSGLMLDMK